MRFDRPQPSDRDIPKRWEEAIRRHVTCDCGNQHDIGPEDAKALLNRIDELVAEVEEFRVHYNNCACVCHAGP